MRVMQTVVIVIISVAFAGSSLSQENGRTLPRMAMAYAVDATLPPSGSGVPEDAQWTITLSAPGSRHIRVEFSDIQDQSDEDYEVVLYRSNLTPIKSYGKVEFAQQSTFWSPVIQGGYVRIVVFTRSNRPPTGLRFRIPQFLYETPGAVQESLRDPLNPRLKPVSSFEAQPEVQKVARSIAKLQYVGRDGTRVCSGFLVGVDLLLTNEHCVPTSRICNMMKIRFDWVPGGDDELKLFRCTKLEKVDPKLDFTLVRLNGRPGEEWGQLRLALREPTKTEEAYVVQYPGISEPKQIALDNCSVTTLEASAVDPSETTDFGHICDTKSGSSGSPVISFEHQVLGLHHWGFEYRDPRWRNENRAVRIKAISSVISSLLQ